MARKGPVCRMSRKGPIEKKYLKYNIWDSNPRPYRPKTDAHNTTCKSWVSLRTLLYLFAISQWYRWIPQNDFLIICKRNIRPNSAPLRDMISKSEWYWLWSFTVTRLFSNLTAQHGAAPPPLMWSPISFSTVTYSLNSVPAKFRWHWKVTQGHIWWHMQALFTWWLPIIAKR